MSEHSLKLEHYHYLLKSLIESHSVQKEAKINGHGHYCTYSFGAWLFRLDTWNSAINVSTSRLIDPSVPQFDNFYIGMNFGGFSTTINEKSYKYFIGKILTDQWRRRYPIKLPLNFLTKEKYYGYRSANSNK